MNDALTWSYVVAAGLVIVHEIDSARWKEWELFRLPGGSAMFILLHVPIAVLILAGLVGLVRGDAFGTVIAFLVAIGGVGAFVVHTWFIRRGRSEFTDWPSRLILWLTLVASLGLLATGVADVV